MAESATRLADVALPQKPPPQRLLSLPFALRCLLATGPKALTGALGIAYRTISDVPRI